MDWERLKTYDGQVVSAFMRRAPGVSEAYAAARGKLAADGLTVSENIRKNVLGDRPCVLTRNLYPYDLAPGIVHLVIWMQEEIPIWKVRRILAAGGLNDVVIFENAPNRKSVRDISHYQVFVRTRRE